MRTFPILVTALVLLVCGCDGSDETAAIQSPASPPVEAGAEERTNLEVPETPASETEAVAPAMPTDRTGVFASEAQAATPQRKIIYNADIAVVVEDFVRAQAEIARLVQRANGYIAEMQITGSPGDRRSGAWRVRVPVEAFEGFLADIERLGELEHNHRTSQDVTERYYDIEARIKNKRTEEERLIQILRETTGKIEDVLRVETELSRVRGEIEQMQGKLRVLEHLSTLTTVTIAVREREKFQPPPPTVASFDTQIARTFHASLQSLIELGKSVVLLAVSWVLWLPVLTLVALLIWLTVRVVLRALTYPTRQARAIGQPPTTPPRAAP